MYKIKLDQETWLCRSHFDDLKDNIWTILDHIRSHYSIFDHFGTFCVISYHLRPTWTILDHFEQLLAIFDNLDHFGKTFNNVGPVWTCLDMLGPVWTC